MSAGPGTLTRPLAARIAALPPIPAVAEAQSDAPPVTDSVIAAASAALERGETHYTDRAGVPALRKLASARLQRQFGVSVDAKDITITCGVAEARFVTLRILLTAGAVVCPDPALRSELVGVCTLIGAPLLAAPPVNGAEMRVLYLSVRDLGDDTLIGLAAAQPGTYVVLDLSAAPFDEAPGVHPALRPGLATRTVTIDGLEYQLPGWRVGWLAGSDMADKLRGFKQALTICTTSVSQWAAVEILNTHEARG